MTDTDQKPHGIILVDKIALERLQVKVFWRFKRNPGDQATYADVFSALRSKGFEILVPANMELSSQENHERLLDKLHSMPKDSPPVYVLSDNTHFLDEVLNNKPDEVRISRINTLGFLHAVHRTGLLADIGILDDTTLNKIKLDIDGKYTCQKTPRLLESYLIDSSSPIHSAQATTYEFITHLRNVLGQPMVDPRIHTHQTGWLGKIAVDVPPVTEEVTTSISASR